VKAGIVNQFHGILRRKLFNCFNCVTSCTHVILLFVYMALVTCVAAVPELNYSA